MYDIMKAASAAFGGKYSVLYRAYHRIRLTNSKLQQF